MRNEINRWRIFLLACLSKVIISQLAGLDSGPTLDYWKTVANVFSGSLSHVHFKDILLVNERRWELYRFWRWLSTFCILCYMVQMPTAPTLLSFVNSDFAVSIEGFGVVQRSVSLFQKPVEGTRKFMVSFLFVSQKGFSSWSNTLSKPVVSSSNKHQIHLGNYYNKLTLITRFTPIEPDFTGLGRALKICLQTWCCWCLCFRDHTLVTTASN